MPLRAPIETMPSQNKYFPFALRALLLLISLEGLGQSLCFLFGVPGTAAVVRQDDQLGWSFFGKRKQGNYWYRFNSIGLRGDDANLKSPVELMFLGDSVTVGKQVPEDKTFSAILGGVNAGFDGYSTMQERDRFKRDLYRLKPKLLVLVACANDIMSNEQNNAVIRETIKDNSSLQNKINIFKYEGFYRLYYMLRFFNERTSPVYDDYYLGLTTTPVDRHAWRDWTNAVLDIKESAKGSRFILVLAPPRKQVEAYRRGAAKFWLNDEFSGFCRMRDLTCLDLLPTLGAHGNPGELYHDYIHPNELGHRIIAQELRHFIPSSRNHSK